jgi:hypothetical protein
VALAATLLLALASLHHHFVAGWLPFFRTNALSIGLFAAGNLISAALIANGFRRSVPPRVPRSDDTLASDRMA